MKWGFPKDDNQAEPTTSAPPLNETIARPLTVKISYDEPLGPFAVKTTNPNPAVQAALSILLINLKLLQDRASSVFPMQLRGIDRTDIDTLVEQAEAVQTALNGVGG